MRKKMRNYLDLLAKTLVYGEKDRNNRTGVDTLSLFGEHLDIRNINEDFPLLTTKRVHFKSIFYELIWMLKGDTNIEYLQDRGITIWDEWADEDGELGPVYGYQWRSFGFLNGSLYIDQIEKVIKDIKKDPFSRRHIVTAWNPLDINDCKLPPCHMMFQFYVHRDMSLSCHMYQRSADLFLGVPFNIASYALLTHLIAKVTNLVPNSLHISFGDSHIYGNHIEQARKQLLNVPRQPPVLYIKKDLKSLNDIMSMEFDDVELVGYNPYPKIEAEVAV